jgi:hypothetical protein
VSGIEEMVLASDEEYEKLKSTLTKEEIRWVEEERLKKGKFMSKDKSIITI